MVNPCQMKVKSAAPMMSVTATTKRFTGFEKFTLPSLHMRAPVAAIIPKRRVAIPPMTPAGIVCVREPNLGQSPMRMAVAAAMI